VRGVGGEALHLAERRLQTGEHRVERIGQPIDLVSGAAPLEPPAQILGADPQRALRHPVYRPERATGQTPAAGGQERHAQGDEHQQGFHVAGEGLARSPQRDRHLDQCRPPAAGLPALPA